MLKELESKRVDELFKTPVLQQTAFWSKIKSRMGADPVALNFKARRSDFTGTGEGEACYIDSDIVVLVQRIDNLHSVAYVPYGPELEPREESSGVFLEELSEQLRSFLPDDCIMIRYDLDWESFWARDDDFYNEKGEWEGPPERAVQELRFNMSTENWNLRKAGSNILPSNTIYLDLLRSDNQILGGMKSKTRYNISLSGRRGVEVKVCGIESLDVWYELYKETAIRNSFFLHSADYFRVLLTEKASDTKSPAEVLLLIAEYDQKPLASMFLVISATRATYLYGASSSSMRNLMATYALQWKAIQTAKSRGCVLYDMFGVSPFADSSHPMYGLYRFKTGFGGKMHHALGCWDYPLKKEIYNSYAAQEMSQQGYHL
jgi:lipid II:glycine glycyltransferase (peptidoglycan interpeptide bridge formation enzyme)